MLGTGEGKIREREDDVCLDSRSRFLLRELAFIERIYLPSSYHFQAFIQATMTTTNI